MWIRSQDLYTLIKCERLSVRQCVSKKHCVIGDECVVLGEYSTLDKALKVLDEIQNAVENTNYYNIDNFSLGTYALKRGHQVYEMPADEEVKA